MRSPSVLVQAAESVTKDTVVFKLTEDSPLPQALQRQEAAVARLNQQICEQVAQASDLHLLVNLLRQHADDLNFLSVIEIANKAAELVGNPQSAGLVPSSGVAAAIASQQNRHINGSSADGDTRVGQQQQQGQQVAPSQGTEQQQPEQQSLSERATQLQQQQQDPGLITQLLTLLPPLILQHAPAFQATHFIQAAASITSLHLTSTSFWQPFTASCDRKLGAFTISQLTTLLTSLATVGYTPNLNWVEKAYRQAKKHMHRSQPSDLAGILWAWGVMGYTPRDAPLLQMMKDRALWKLKGGGFSREQLLQLMFGLARMPRYGPSKRWLLIYATATEGHIQHLPPGELQVALSVLLLKQCGLWLVGRYASQLNWQQSCAQLGVTPIEPCCS